MLGGLDALLPKDRRAELATLGIKSIPAGLLSTCITAAIVGAVA
jgi:CNT family concentrative nucleoside transporter